MSVIGIDLEADQLVLIQDRDFKWAFENLDESDAPVNYPSGSLYVELFTGGEHNCVQRVTELHANSGTYKLSYGGVASTAIDYYDVTVAPQDLGGDVTAALSSISGLSGNVKVTNVSLRPEWRLAITLNSGVNEVQHIYFNDQADGGNYKLTFGNQRSSTIAFGAAASVVQTALQGLSSIGSGNCTVTDDDTGGYYVEFIGAKAEMDVDQIGIISHGLGFGLHAHSIISFLAQGKVETLNKGSSKLGEQIVNTLNDGVNAFFDQFENLLGQDISFTLTDQRNVTFIATGRKSYTENELLTFRVDVTSNAIKSFFNGIASFLGVFDTINVDFRWNHTYDVEFINDKGNQPIALMGSDIALLGSADGDHSVTVEIVEPGKAPTTKWPFTIVDSTASIKIESEEVNKILPRTRWHLVFLPTGETAGGDPVARGRVTVEE